MTMPAVHGEAGVDNLYRGDGQDRISGGDGDDLLNGGTASDTMRRYSTCFTASDLRIRALARYRAAVVTVGQIKHGRVVFLALPTQAIQPSSPRTDLVDRNVISAPAPALACHHNEGFKFRSGVQSCFRRKTRTAQEFPITE